MKLLIMKIKDFGKISAASGNTGAFKIQHSISDGHIWFVFLSRKEFLKLTPTLLIIGSVLYFSRRLSSGAKGQGVRIFMMKYFINY